MKTSQILGLTALLAFRVAAQEPVIIRNVEITEPQTPVYQSDDGTDTVQIKGMPQNAAGKEKWFRVSIDFETRPEWINRLKFEYYILLTDKDGADVLFKGVVSYSDVPAGRNHLSDMYLHFNTWKRFHKRSGVGYAVAALVDGNEVAFKTNKREPAGWWKTICPAGELLNRLDTPFRVLNEELYQAQCH